MLLGTEDMVVVDDGFGEMVLDWWWVVSGE